MDYIPYVEPTDSKVPRDSGLGHSLTVKFSNLPGESPCEFSIIVQLSGLISLAASATPLGIHISHVLFLRSSEKMVRPNTDRIVTLVADYVASRDLTNK